MYMQEFVSLQSDRLFLLFISAPLQTTLFRMVRHVMRRSIRIHAACHSMFDFWLAYLFWTTDMSIFKDGNGVLRNAGIRRSIQQINSHVITKCRLCTHSNDVETKLHFLIILNLHSRPAQQSSETLLLYYINWSDKGLPSSA